MGLELDILWLTILMFGSLAVLLMAGLPLAFVTGGLGCIFLFIFGSVNELNILPSRIFPFMTDYQLSAIPLFIFMAAMLERAGIIEELFDVVYKLLGGLRGGLASATIVSSTILAAMVGVIGAAEVAMGILALPAMLKRGYDPHLACGSILAGGTLGILIPPSILAILFAVVAQQSVGDLFIGAVIPGLLLSGLYIFYVTARSYINPKAGPALPPEERVDLQEKIRLLKGVFAPVLLIILVLGVIFSGIATPVEAAGIGTFGAIFVAAMHRKLHWPAVSEAATTTLKASAMVLWIIFGASIFVGFYVLKGGQQFVADLLIGTGFGPYGILLIMMIILVILGMFLDWVGILLLAVPIFLPILLKLEFNGLLGFDGPTAGITDPDKKREALQLWFGVVYMVNMQMSFLSPPFGYALFYLKSVAPPEIDMGTIFRSALPFLLLQAIGLAFCIIFPQLILWLPGLVYGG
ncbi:MAG: TRAP transporter large permease [Methyloligellaceae bacterium]